MWIRTNTLQIESGFVIINKPHTLITSHINLYRAWTLLLFTPWNKLLVTDFCQTCWLHPHCVPNSAKVNQSCLFCRPKRLCDLKIPQQNPHAVVQHHCLSVRLPHSSSFHSVLIRSQASRSGPSARVTSRTSFTTSANRLAVIWIELRDMFTKNQIHSEMCIMWIQLLFHDVSWRGIRVD